MIYLGDTEILGIKLGNSDIEAIYAGDLLIYPTTVTAWSVTPTQIEMASTGGTEQIKIASLSAWTISSSENWITFSQNSGDSGRTTVVATIASHTDSSARTATITATDGVNVSTIAVTQEAPNPYYSQYLTLEITKAGNLKWYAQNDSYRKTLEYKKNDGEWTQITSTRAGTLVPVAVGDIIQLRGDNAQYAPQDGRCSCWCGTTANYKMYGNIMSLVNSTGFATLSSFTAPNVFMNFFNSGGCIDAENLILPATALTNYCYQGMLAQSANLKVGPLLPVETLVQGCYAYLFYHSYQINNIRCLAINKSASNCLQEWVNGAPSSGTFYKNPNMSSWNRGNSGVPNNWTIVDYS